MGNTETIQLSEAAVLRQLQLPHIGPSTLMSLNEQQCLLKTYSFPERYLQDDFHRRLKPRLSQKCSPSVLNMYKLVKRQHKEICSNNYQLMVYMESFDTTLKEALERRLAQKKNYSEEEIAAFLLRMVEGLIFIQDNGYRNILLDCESIVFCGETVKVLDECVAVSKSYAALLLALEKGEKCGTELYLAPELLRELGDLNYDPYISPKADIFSLGMIVMEMVGLESMLGYYDYQGGSIDYDSLIHRLSRVSHSLSFKTIIAEMLEYDPEERIGLVSLREKMQKLTSTEQSMSRSKSSKMLQDMLSNSRRSGSRPTERSGSRPTERSGSLPRNQSSGGKERRIELRCSSRKRESQVKMDTEPSVVPLTDRNPNIGNLPEQNTSDLKNLVKNKLAKKKESRREMRPLPGAKTMLQGRNFEQNIPSFQSSMASRHLGISERSNRDSGKGVRSTLNKLVEESGMNKLLKLEQLEQLEVGSSKKSQGSAKNTSRFGFYENNSSKGVTHETSSRSKASNVYIQEHRGMCERRFQTVAYSESREDVNITPSRPLQKVMTFNKEFIINARSVENSIEHLSRVINTSPSQLAISSVDSCHQKGEGASSYKNITIEDVPVVISQEKIFEGPTPPNHFGRLQRQLNLFDEARIGESVDNSINNVSKVIGGYRPSQDDYSSLNDHHYPQEFSAPFKKQRSRRPQLVIQVDQEEQDEAVLSYQPPRPSYQPPRPSYQPPRPSYQPQRPSYENVRTNQESQHLSNFTSISPPGKQEESNPHIYIENNTSPSMEGSESRVQLANGDEFEGEMLGELPHGNGVIYRKGKVFFSGSFKFGKYSGYGTLFNLDFTPGPVDHKFIDLSRPYWDRFEGEFENGCMSGFGTIFFEGEKFSGCLRGGVIEGYGCFYGRNGELVSGLWSESRYRKV